MKMDKTITSQIFQELVLNNHMIPYGQLDYIFSFKTVFHISKYFTYCMCPCAFEHENFDYISESGEINQEMFHKIAESIRTGACPHVNMVPEECLTSTMVKGIHIVAAVGSEGRILHYLQNMSHKPLSHPCISDEYDPVITGVLKHTPYSIALLKNKAVVTNTEFDVFHQFLYKHLIPEDYELCALVHGTRDSANSDKVELKHESMIEISLQQQSVSMLKCIVSTLLPIAKPRNIAKVYEVVYRHNREHELLPEIYTLMTTKLQEITINRHEEQKFVAETMIVCNQPDLFENLIKVLDLRFRCKCGSFEDNLIYNCFCCNCKRICRILHRTECECVFDGHCESETLERLNDKHERLNESVLNETTMMDQKYLSEAWETGDPHDFQDNKVFIGIKTRSLMYLLHDHPFSKTDIQVAMQMIPDLHYSINIPNANGVTPLRLYLCNKLKVEAVRLLMENGSDIDIEGTCTGISGSAFTFLFELKNLNWRNTEFEFRQILELFLYLNPSFEKGKAVVAQGLKSDAKLLEPDEPRPSWTRPIPFSEDMRRYCRQGEPWKYVCHEVLQGTYHMDAQEHSFLYEDLLDICLNFFGPLLIESGCPIQRKHIEETLQKTLHPAVRDYLKQCLDIPKTLKSLCRDRLRKHFKGRKIHEYVRILNLPESVRDFILLKTILPTVTHDEWNTVKLYDCKC